MIILVGIDPGAGGGIAWCMGGALPIALPMPKTERDISDVLESISAEGRPEVWIESVHAMPKQGVSSTFMFGQNYGFLRGCLATLKVIYHDLTPHKWQKSMGLIRTKKDESITAKKNRHKQMAQQMCPHLKVTHAVADALLICEYAKRVSAEAAQ